MKFKISKAISIFMIICIVMASSNVMCFAIAAKDYGWSTTNHTFSPWKENGVVHDISVSKNTEVYAIADGTVECRQAYTVINGKKTQKSTR